MKITGLLLAIFGIVLNSADAVACACCTSANTFESSAENREIAWTSPVTFSGELGADSNGSAEGPEIKAGKSTVHGAAKGRTIFLAASSDGKSLGELEIELVGAPEITRIGMDVILPHSEYKKFKLDTADSSSASIYHQWKQTVRLKPNAKLEENFGAKISGDALLVFHGYSNNCWSPEEEPGNWTLIYEVSKGKDRKKAIGRGAFK